VEAGMGARVMDVGGVRDRIKMGGVRVES